MQPVRHQLPWNAAISAEKAMATIEKCDPPHLGEVLQGAVDINHLLADPRPLSSPRQDAEKKNF